MRPPPLGSLWNVPNRWSARLTLDLEVIGQLTSWSGQPTGWARVDVSWWSKVDGDAL